MKNNMKPRNIECAGEDGICAICVIGENLRDDEPCQYDRWRSENGCPGFECGEQCRLCPEDCEFSKPKMTLNEYQEFAARTMKPRRDLTDDLSDYILGLVGEAGELANTAKKMLFHGHDWDERKLLEEAGDVAWYLAAVVTRLGASLEEVARQNIEKLRKRYPEGFSEERSREREDENA